MYLQNKTAPPHVNSTASCKAVVQVPFALWAENSEEEMVAKVFSDEGSAREAGFIHAFLLS